MKNSTKILGTATLKIARKKAKNILLLNVLNLRGRKYSLYAFIYTSGEYVLNQFYLHIDFSKY